MCKCVNGNGISGGSNGGVNGEKITAEFTVYTVEETSGGSPTPTINNYIKKEDAESLFNAIVSLDPEKYTFYQVVEQTSSGVTGAINYACYSCDYMYAAYDDGSVFIQNNNIDNAEDTLFGIYRENSVINYNGSVISDNKIAVDPLPNTAVTDYTVKYILYYREL